jgi:hypothetical protein
MLDDTKKPNFTEREWTLLSTVADTGVKPISPSLSAEMLNLYMESYSCEQIAHMNKGFAEVDVLYCRYKYDWDGQRDRYAKQLQEQVVQKLAKLKMESMEFLSNMLSILHKDEREKMIAYLQSGREEDRPKIWATNITTYKSVIETIQKLTGEDKIQKHEVKAEHRMIASPELKKAITKDIQTSLLRQLVTGPGKVKGKGE